MKNYLILVGLVALVSTPVLANEVAKKSDAPLDHVAAEGTKPEHGMNHMMDDRMKKHGEYMWKEMDTDNDGVITKEESTAFGNRKFEERDANHDGKVTREEWDNFRKEKMEQRMKERMGKSGDATPDAKKEEVPAETKK